MHHPVMAREVVSLLRVSRGGAYIDCTAGYGGHAEAVLIAACDDCRLLAVDCDATALELASGRLRERRGVCAFVRGNFEDIENIARSEGFEEVDGILMDLGMSSMQIDDARRGFSFMKEGPLDMRMDSSLSGTAADIVNEASPEDLWRIIREFGEEPMAGKIVKEIMRERAGARIVSTERLAEIVSVAKRGRRGRIHPATRTFQALRIAVNREMDVLEKGLNGAFGLLKRGGRLAVLSYHSLEDRRVKRFFKSHAGVSRSLESGGSEWVGEHPAGRLVNNKVLRPSVEEVELNPRSVSAKLRVIERTE